MSDKRVVSSEIWRDTKFRREMKSQKCKYLWLYLLTCPSSQSIGIFYLPIDEIVIDTKLDIDEVKQNLMSLTDLGMLDYDMETEEILIYNYPKHNIGAWGKPIIDKINSELSKVSRIEFISKEIEYLKTFVSAHPNDKRASIMEKVIPLYVNALKPVNEKERDLESNKVSSSISNSISINNVPCHETLEDKSNISLNNSNEDDTTNWNDLCKSIEVEENENNE